MPEDGSLNLQAFPEPLSPAQPRHLVFWQWELFIFVSLNSPRIFSKCFWIEWMTTRVTGQRDKEEESALELSWVNHSLTGNFVLKFSIWVGLGVFLSIPLFTLVFLSLGPVLRSLSLVPPFRWMVTKSLGNLIEITLFHLFLLLLLVFSVLN